ncbi:predicted protein [Nematostella vectensis]|uniref:RRM domain-containing protein n=1 Tax=Nematostella vectensis TaxID=45351 RepID=A7SC28_NEMVE|nr:predicted protein [Nematostella vectensis]|eukprot:XP_001630826.1 predicted protein [Nematostella vectensis]
MAQETPLTEEAKQLVNIGVSLKVAQRVGEIFSSGSLAPEELDDRALDALREFNEEGALEVLNQFASSDLSHVQNKSAFLCGVMKTYREKNRMRRDGQDPTAGLKGPDEAKIKALLDRTGYTLDITTGQRKYGGPPPGWEGKPPGTGSEKVCSQVFIGKVPRDCFEDELIPVFEECGHIYDFRLMIDPISGLTKGFAFCTFSNKDEAQNAVKKLDNKEIRPGKRLGVCISVANSRLFVGSIPKTKSKQEILEEFSKVTNGLDDVIVYLSADQKGKNRGFAFLEYESHQAASLARRRLASGRIKVWGNIVVTVDWADPQEEPDDDAMKKVKVVYLRNLSPSITEEKLKEEYSQYGAVDRVKKLKDYAFVHFTERDHALKAIEETDGKEMDGLKIEASLAKPQPGNKDRQRGQSGFGSLNSRRGGPRGYDGGYGQGGGYEGYSGGYRDDYGYGGGSYDHYDSYYGGGYDDYYGGGPPRGGPRGGRGGSRGGPPRGAPRGRSGPPRGRGGGDFGGRGGRGGTTPGKRKYGADNPQGVVGYPEPKKRFMAEGQQDYQGGGGWGSQPISQQPQYSSYSDQGQEWYQDSYGSEW